MAKLATELLNEQDKQDNKFSIGNVFSTSFSIIPYEFPIYFLMVMAAGVMLLVSKLALAVLIIEFPLVTSGRSGAEVFGYYSIFNRSVFFVSEAVFYPIASVFITRRVLTGLQRVQPPMKLELQGRHYFLAIGIGTLLTVVLFMCHGIFINIIDVKQAHISSNSVYFFLRPYLLANALASLIVMLIFSSVLVALIPVYISENVRFSLLFRRVNDLVRGNRLAIIIIILISSATIWFALRMMLNIGLSIFLPTFLLRYGLVAIILFPIQSFLYAYMFMLPAVIYHHLRLDESSREGE
jgi:hypothetical protein